MVTILNHFKKVWGAYKTNFIPIVLSIILISLTLLLFFGLGFFALFGAESAAEIANSYMISGEPTDFESPEFLDSVNIQNLGFFSLFLVLGLVIAIFLQAGFWGVCLNGIKKKVNMKTFFITIRERGLSYFLASLLVFLIIAAISIPLVLIFYGLVYLLQITSFVPVVYLIILLLVTPFFIFVSPAIVEGKSISNSLSQSFKLGKKNYLDLILLIITLYVFSLVSFIPIVGLLLIYFLIVPLFTLVICSFYIEVSKSGKGKIGISKIEVKREKKTKKITKTKKPVKAAGKSRTKKSVRGKRK